jgi:aminoglycoside phosphotransferase (APT) family kinase protein
MSAPGDALPAGKMYAGEIDIDAALVRRLLAAQFPQWAELPIEPVASTGTDNAIYRLGDDMAVRLPRIDWAVGQVELEERWLPALAPLLPVAIPRVLATGEPGEGYPWRWSIHAWLSGENPVPGRIAHPGSLATELAHLVSAFQQIDPAGGPSADRGVPLARRDAATRTALSELDGFIDVAAATAAWQRALRADVWTGPPVWIHGDLSPGNLLCIDGRLYAVIDFGCLGVGDPACDLIVAWNLLPADARDVFRAALQVDDATWDRGRGWALSIALIQLPYYHRTNPELAAGARFTIGAVLGDRAYAPRRGS